MDQSKLLVVTNENDKPDFNKSLMTENRQLKDKIVQLEEVNLAFFFMFIINQNVIKIFIKLTFSV
jgi:hypothetical protein